MDPLAGRCAIVTGGGTGVGFGITRCLLRHGVKVTIAARRIEVLDEAATRLRAEIPDASIRSVRCDVTVETDVAEAIEAASHDGILDIAVANAGSGALGPVLEADPEAWRRILDLNVVGTLNTLKHAARSMRARREGSIVAISSPAAVRPMPWLGPYSPSKAAVEMLVRQSAVELGPFGIRVNGIRPGLVRQESLDAILTLPDMREALESAAPLRLEGGGEEIGEYVAFLSSTQGAWTTGQIVSIDGGFSIPSGPSWQPVIEQLFPEVLPPK